MCQVIGAGAVMCRCLPIGRSLPNAGKGDESAFAADAARLRPACEADVMKYVLFFYKSADVVRDWHVRGWNEALASE
jgi:hypothetical protein